jgi:hypothetical protein
VEQGSPARGLKELLGYPLVAALADRRTRRICRGTSVDLGEFSYASANLPAPLSELEEAVLIVTTGLAGISMHDVPAKRNDGVPMMATPQMQIPSRAASSADNAQGVYFILINDQGTWLLQQKRGREAVEWMEQFPPDRALWTQAVPGAARFSPEVAVLLRVEQGNLQPAGDQHVHAHRGFDPADDQRAVHPAFGAGRRAAPGAGRLVEVPAEKADRVGRVVGEPGGAGAEDSV